MKIAFANVSIWLVIVGMATAPAAGFDNNVVDIQILDASTKAPVGAAFVTGRQFYYMPGGFHHSPAPACFREETGVTGPQGGVQLQLPELAEISMLAPRMDDGRPLFPT
jgi:hypothetical protein